MGGGSFGPTIIPIGSTLATGFFFYYTRIFSVGKEGNPRYFNHFPNFVYMPKSRLCFLSHMTEKGALQKQRPCRQNSGKQEGKKMLSLF